MTTIDVTGKVHDLKCWDTYYDAIADGSKPFDVRVNDRRYMVGDILRLRRYDSRAERYTGEEQRAVVTYVYHGDSPSAPLMLRGFVDHEIDGRPNYVRDEIVVLGLALGIEVGN